MQNMQQQSDVGDSRTVTRLGALIAVQRANQRADLRTDPRVIDKGH
jgi:hypothetical protein